MSKVDQAAEVLFSKFQNEFPQTDMKASGSKSRLSKTDIDQRLKRFYGEARAERQRNRFWVIGWARVVFKLQKRLLHAGYPAEMISKLLLAMILTSSSAH